MTRSDRDRLDLYDIKTRSLREYLVPAPKWFERFKEIECNGPVSVLVAPDTKPLANFWVAPYPYTVPIWATYLRARFPDTTWIGKNEIAELTQSDYENIQNLLEDRLESFVRCMLSESTLAAIDDNPDVGIILHGTSGIIRPFLYSELDHVECVVMPVACEFQVAAVLGKERLPMNREEANNYLRYLYDNRFECNAWIQPYYKNPQGDHFTKTEDHRASWSITENSTMPVDGVYDVLRYIDAAMYIHTKVIRIP